MKEYDSILPTLSIRVGTVAADATASDYAMVYTDTNNASVTLCSGSDVLTLLTQMRGNARVILTGDEDLTKAQLETMTRSKTTTGKRTAAGKTPTTWRSGRMSSRPGLPTR